nr:PH13-2-104(-) [Vibrio phage 1]
MIFSSKLRSCAFFPFLGSIGGITSLRRRAAASCFCLRLLGLVFVIIYDLRVFCVGYLVLITLTNSVKNLHHIGGSNFRCYNLITLRDTFRTFDHLRFKCTDRAQ